MRSHTQTWHTDAIVAGIEYKGVGQITRTKEVGAVPLLSEIQDDCGPRIAWKKQDVLEVLHKILKVKCIRPQSEKYWEKILANTFVVCIQIIIATTFVIKGFIF